jgi:hypothetical protein
VQTIVVSEGRDAQSAEARYSQAPTVRSAISWIFYRSPEGCDTNQLVATS